MNMDFRWIKQRGHYIATIHDTRMNPPMEHHFEADPKVLSSDHIWMEWMKLVADFMADKGIDTKIIKAKIQLQADVYSEQVLQDEQNQEQTPTVGGPDDSSGHGAPTGRDGAADSGELHGAGPNGTPPPIAPDWPAAPEVHGPSAAAADAHAD